MNDSEEIYSAPWTMGRDSLHVMNDGAEIDSVP
jgi:hypothetical protein